MSEKRGLWAFLLRSFSCLHSTHEKLLPIVLLAAVLPALGQAQSANVSVPLMLAPDSERQGFVRIINKTDESGMVRIVAFDDAGTAANPIEIQLAANESLHFNSEDLADGNAAKGISGIGLPHQGHWRLSVETALEDVRVLAFVRTRAGFLTAMHDVLPRDAQGRIVAEIINPGSNATLASSLRLVNPGANSERVSIAGVDDQGNNAGPVTLTLAAGQSRTISAFDLEEGAQGLTGSLGNGAGKWRLLVTAGQSVVGMSLLETQIGPMTNLSTMGVPAAAMTPTQPDDDHGRTRASATNLALGGQQSGRIDPADDTDAFRIRVSEAGTLTVYTTGNLDTYGALFGSQANSLVQNDDGGAGTNFRIRWDVSAGTYYVAVESYNNSLTGNYTVHAEFAETSEPPGEYCGAFAVSTLPSGSYGWATNAPTRAAARRAAEDDCFANGGRGCQVTDNFGTGECLAIAVEGTGGFVYLSGPRARLSEIEQTVLRECRLSSTVPNSCRLVTADNVCNDGTAGGYNCGY